MFDLRDAYANGLGVVIGASVGLIIRGIYAYIQKDLAIARVKHKLVCFETGSVILREEEPVQKFYIIKSGTVRATREVNGKPVYLNDVGPGAVVGVISVIQGKPQYSTITSLSPTTLYSMGLDELMDSAGGREQPVSTVLMVMADYLQKAGDIISHLRAEPLTKNEQPPPQRSHFS
ncbi:MAG: cyclic nucleotide-binding domain-containing protein [Deltaproteobacteria bacterium]|nr:cyclic nucleotide-binding domain-containing protein [Deltaproteobacteria bacterium]